MRKLRVYNKTGGFTVEIPDEARVTFGYFNPGAQQYPTAHKPTALRIYAGESTKAKENQIACFLDVTGFRDLALKYEPVTPNDML